MAMAVQPEDCDFDRPTPVALVHARDIAQRRSFEVPQHGVMLHAKCPMPYCNGTSYAEHGSIWCTLCGRELYIAAISDTGRVLKLTMMRMAPVLSRAGYGERQRAAKSRARQEGGLVGLASRVLKAIPEAPEYTVVERLAQACAAHRADIREALDALQDQGLVESFDFRGGYRTGWRRTRRDT